MGKFHQGDNAVELPLLEYAPDADITKPGILLDMQGVRPTVKGFEALPSPVIYGDAPPLVGSTDSVRGSIVEFYDAGGGQTDSALVAGTSEHLWRWPIPGPGGVPQQWDSGQTFTLGLSARWRFFQFGNSTIALANGVVPQISRQSTLSFTTMIGAVVPGPGGVDLTDATVGCTSAGTAFVFKDDEWFAAAPGIVEDAGTTQAWVPDVQTLAANGFLYDYPGPIVGCAPFYRTVLAFKEQAIWQGSFVGPPNSWQWQLISDNTGARSQEAIVVLPDSVAFLGTDDFYVTTGSVPIRIPNNVKEWFFDTADPHELPKVLGWYDASHSVICWHFVSTNPPYPGIPDMFVEYNVRARRWAKGQSNVLDAPRPNSSVIHPAPIFFDPDSEPVEMTGPAQNMILTTGWNGNAGQLTQLLRARPKYRLYPATQQLMAYSVNALGQIPPFPVQGVPTIGDDSWFALRSTGRYHQLVLSTSGDAEIMALSYEARTAGNR